jgi:hypothetical protein
MRWFLATKEATAYRERFSISAVPVANPDGWASGSGPANGAGSDPTRGYPPTGDAYSSATDPEAAYLWRWIGMRAPDLVVEVRASRELAWLIPANSSAALSSLAARLQPSQTLPEADELVSQLALNSPSGIGSIPALRRNIVSKNEAFLEPLLRALEEARFRGPSQARQEMQRRLNRTPLQVARELANYYGHKLDDPAYIPAMAVIGRLRLGELSGDPSHLAAAEALAQPFVTVADTDRLATLLDERRR